MKAVRPIEREKLPSELRLLIANVLDKDQEELSASANLVEQMGLDSVMRLEILVTLERTYGVKIAYRIHEHVSADVAYKRYVMQGNDHLTSSSAYPKAHIFTVGLTLWF